MPKVLQVRNVPDDVHAALRRRAAAAGMSLSEYALRELADAVARPTLEEVFARAERRGGAFTFEQAVDAVHAGRRRR